jgi:16S rRNA C967 or C1407 C5-methylase (RsmB/RsmF family)
MAKESFDRFYSDIYGTRWPFLRASLCLPTHPVEYHEGLLQPYHLDEGSIIAAKTLPVADADEVLDMCAAPGGKSLVLATRMKESSLMVSNDRSSQRRGRLRKVLDEHLPEQMRNRIKVTSHDATKWGIHEQQRYDAVLLDAPCSSERHVLQDAKALSQWSPSRSKRLAIQQFAMLAAALEAVRIGGHILYSTCSISPLENEQVIGKLYKKREERFEEVSVFEPLSEQLEHGFIIMPDTAAGRGPLYFCLLRRIS